MTAIPDLRYETARDHLLQALAILPREGAAVIRMLIEEAARRCENQAFREPEAQTSNTPDPFDQF